MNTTNTKPQNPEKTRERRTFAPPVDIYENKDEILILADVPGVTTEGLSVNLDRDQLTIEARRPQAASGEEAFDYRRTFVVSHGVDPAKIAATLQGGVLRLVLPKPDTAKPRQIAVKAG